MSLLQLMPSLKMLSIVVSWSRYTDWDTTVRIRQWCLIRVVSKEIVVCCVRRLSFSFYLLILLASSALIIVVSA